MVIAFLFQLHQRRGGGGVQFVLEDHDLVRELHGCIHTTEIVAVLRGCPETQHDENRMQKQLVMPMVSRKNFIGNELQHGVERAEEAVIVIRRQRSMQDAGCLSRLLGLGREFVQQGQDEAALHFAVGVRQDVPVIVCGQRQRQITRLVHDGLQIRLVPMKVRVGQIRCLLPGQMPNFHPPLSNHARQIRRQSRSGPIMGQLLIMQAMHDRIGVVDARAALGKEVPVVPVPQGLTYCGQWSLPRPGRIFHVRRQVSLQFLFREAHQFAEGGLMRNVFQVVESGKNAGTHEARDARQKREAQMFIANFENAVKLTQDIPDSRQIFL